MIYQEGQLSEVGLLDVFKDAHLIRSLAGELPTQDLAILRVLLAALYAIYLRKNGNGCERTLDCAEDAYDEWKQIWDMGKFEPAIIDEYFSSYENKFFLFHPERPFFQAKIKVGTPYSAAKLNSEVSESNHKRRLFIPVSGSNKSAMTYSQAARWLIHANAFDDASAKQKDKNAEHVTMGTAWLGRIGPVYAEGNNLFETLMLNLVLVINDDVVYDGHPVWEEESPRTAERTVIPMPDSPAQLLTLQSRRISLTRSEDGRVTGYDVVGGDILSTDNALIEQMTSWKNDSSKNVWTPKRLRENASLWRDYSSLMLRTKKDSETYMIPGVVRWLRELQERGYIPFRSIRMRASGIKYDSNSSSIVNNIDDSLSINSKLLSEMNDIWNYRISKSINTIDDGVRHIGTFQAELLECDGFKIDDDNVKSRREYAKGEAYYRIDQPFRRWLSDIDPEADDLEGSVSKLYGIVRSILLKMGYEMFDEVNSTAMVGKTKSVPSKNCIHVNAFKSFSKFENMINKTFRRVAEDENQL